MLSHPTHHCRILCSILLLAAAGGAFGAADDIINVDDLPHTTLILPNGTRSTIIKYGEHNWREATASILTSTDENDADVCFEAKFEALVPPDKLKLMGMLSSLQIEDRIKFKELTTQLKPGDNIWIAGELRKSRDGKSVTLNVIHVLKQLRDLDRYDQRISVLEKKNDFEALIDLGHRIEQQRTGNPTGFESFDKLGVLRNKAYETGLRLKEASLKRDDADGLFAVALQWKELLNRNSNFRALTEKCLKIDPDHPKAKRFADELGLVMYEGAWHHGDEVERIKAQRKLDQERMDAAQKAAIEAKQKELDKAVAERPLLLNKFQAAIRVADAKARAAAITDLGEAVHKSPDAGFGREAVDILVNLSDPSAVAGGLAKAAQSELPEVRKDVYEALVWRGRQPGSNALETMAASLKSEKDATAARSGVDSLVSLGGKPAAATLIASLDTPDRNVGEEIMEGLKLITKQSLGSREAWKDWWSKNKDSFAQ